MTPTARETGAAGGYGEPEPAGLRSGEVADQAGVNLQTLRYYERRGLLAEPRRSPGGHRLYPHDTVTLLRVIKAAQRLGFTLHEVAELLEDGRHRHGQPADAGLRRRAREKLTDIQRRIADLHVIADTLRAALDAGCDDLVTCARTPGCPLPLSDLATEADSGGGAVAETGQATTARQTRRRL